MFAGACDHLIKRNSHPTENSKVLNKRSMSTNLELVDRLHMNGGKGENSYANSSMYQKLVLLETRMIKEEAIAEVYHMIASFIPTKDQTLICIADLGCSCGPNTFMPISHLITHISQLSKEHGRLPPRFQVFLNDLPGNDFNTVFGSVKSFKESLKRDIDHVGECFIHGVPGSFYEMLFPPQSLHFVHSSCALHWLSRVPKGLESNKRNIYITKESPPSTLQAYYEQFQRDFEAFLRCRSTEMVDEGFMVLTLLGRKHHNSSTGDYCYVFDIVTRALIELVEEGLIQEQKLDTLNIPVYTPSTAEIENEVQREGSFIIRKFDVSEVSWQVDEGHSALAGNTMLGHKYAITRCMRSVCEPLFINHFGEEIMEEVFCRFNRIIQNSDAKDQRNSFIIVTVSMKKKGS